MLTLGDMEDAVHDPGVKDAVARGDVAGAVDSVVKVLGPRIRATENHRCASYFIWLAGEEDDPLSIALRRVAEIIRDMPK